MSNQVHEGVYTCIGGPTFETIAENRMLRKIRVDAVGMSTVHEVIIASHCGLTTLAFSLVTDNCPTDYAAQVETEYKDAADVGRKREALLKVFVERVVAHIWQQKKLQGSSCPDQ